MGDRDRRAERMRAGEWVGGRFSAPYYVDEGDPYRPDIVLWIDATNDLIVGLHMDRPPVSDDEVAAVVVRTLAGPVAVPSPARIRVRSESLADAVRRALGSGVRVVVGPTPDLDAVFEDLAEQTARGATRGRTYLERGRIPEPDVAWLFRWAAAPHRVAPWSILDDSQILRLDVPALGVEGACMSPPIPNV